MIANSTALLNCENAERALDPRNPCAVRGQSVEKEKERKRANFKGRELPLDIQVLKESIYNLANFG